MHTIAGIATARGFVAGPVFIYRGDGNVPVPEYVVESDKVDDELLRLRRAKMDTRRDLESLLATLRERSSDEDVKVFECHLMMLEDEVFDEEIRRYIVEDCVNAECAVRRATNAARAKFEHMNDAYFRERIRDIDDVERRLQKALTGFAGNPHLELKTPSIVVADDLTPSETVQLPREYVLGFATNGGSATSHVALLARAMGIPAVTGLGNITSLVTAGEEILLDGTNGAVTVSPDVATVMDFRDLIERQKEIVEETQLGAVAGTLKDGSIINIYANVHPGVPILGVKGHGARGIGLYRSEYLWLNRGNEPTEDEQFSAYREAVKLTSTLSPDASITIRTLDIGGDKLVRGISEKESNPFLGNRSIRYLLSNLDVFKAQLSAILRASAFGKVRMMYPMVSCVEELREAAVVVEDVRRKLDADGVAYDRQMPIGAMIEVPSAAINAAALARHVDFFSIGTNDLVQYVMAADRGNESVAHLYQPTNPAVLKLMRNVISAAKQAEISVSVCGESAADPIVGVLWAAMGVDTLSMSTMYIPVISKLLSRLTRADLDDYLASVDAMGEDVTAAEILERCNHWMEEHVSDLSNIVI